MSIETRGIGLAVTDALRAHAQRRMRFALGRYGRAVRHATVRLIGANSSAATCRVVVSTRRGDVIVVENRDRDLYAAIGAAARRLDRAVGKAIERGRRADVDRDIGGRPLRHGGPTATASQPRGGDA